MRKSTLSLLLGPAALLAASMAHGQAAIPEDHPGYPLAQAIAEQGCVLHQDDVVTVMEGLGLDDGVFPQMAVPLMQTGFLQPGSEGTLVLVNWGLCTGEVPEVETEVEADTETETDAESE